MHSENLKLVAYRCISSVA